MDYLILTKKGALFSVIAILMAALFFFVMLPSSENNLLNDLSSAETRVHVLDGLVSSFDNYFENSLEVTIPQTMNGLNDYIVDNGFINESEFQCAVEHMALDGVYRDIRVIPSVGWGDLHVAIEPGVVSTLHMPITHNIGTFNNVQKIISPVKTRVQNITVSMQYSKDGLCPDPLYHDIKVYLLNELCGKPGRALDSANATLEFNNGQVRYNVTLNFTKNYQLDKGEIFYIHYTANTETGIPGCDPLLVSSLVNETTIPYSNESSLSITETKYDRMDNKFIEYFGEILQNYSSTNLSVDFDYKIRNLQVSQIGPWDIQAELNITYYLEDPIASWETDSVVRTSIPIAGLLDPIFVNVSDGTGTSINRTIKRNESIKGIWAVKTPSSNHTIGNYSLFEAVYNNSWYIPSSRAPSYLQRFVNNSNGSACCGIESLVNASYPNRFNNSYIGYQYWQNITYECRLGELWEITNDPLLIFDDFKLDKSTVAYYGYGEAGDTTFSEIIC